VATQLDSTDLRDEEEARFAVEELRSFDTGELDVACEGADEPSRLADAKLRAHRDHDVLRIEDPRS
jgi:hypothetical protein